MFGISKGYALKVLFGTVFVLNICVASAQRPITSNQNRNQYGTLPGLNNQNQNQMQYGSIGGVQDNDAPEEEADTTKKPPKIRKPLESYFFNDSIRARQSFAWNVNLERNDIDIIDVDTALVGFQNEYPYLQNNVGSAYLGNLGAASVPLDYFLRPQYRNFSFAQSFDAYLFTPQRVRYFNVKKPFTHLSYFMSGQTRRLEESFWGPMRRTFRLRRGSTSITAAAVRAGSIRGRVRASAICRSPFRIPAKSTAFMRAIFTTCRTLKRMAVSCATRTLPIRSLKCPS